jgi:hypothetical protein
LGLPQHANPARRIEDRGLPLRVGDQRDGRPDEHAGHEQQAALLEVERLLELLLDPQHAVGPRDGGIHVGEQALGAAVGDLARTVQDVALEDRAQARPVRRQRAAPIRAQQLDQRADRRGRVVEERLEHRRQLSAAIGAMDLRADLVGRGRLHARELVLELRERARGRRREEVRRVDADRVERAQRREVEVGGRPPGLDRPRQVQRLAARVLEHSTAVAQLRQRRDREAHARERARTEPHREH